MQSLRCLWRSVKFGRFAAAVVAIGIAGAGCNSASHGTVTEYRTVASDLRRDTDLARLQNLKAVTLIEETKWDEAERVLKTALEADITFGPAHNNLGKVYFHEDRLYLAAWEFQYAIKSMPYQPEPRNNLGLVLEATGKLDAAADCYDEARSMQQDNPVFACNSARVRVRRGDRDATLVRLLEMIVSNSDDPDWVDWSRQTLTLLRTSATRPVIDP
jgi:Flp pilus assembly protein TadD